MRVELQPSYVLHARPYRDTSLLVDCFTQDYGRLTLVAKGGRKPKQQQLLQAFRPLLLSWQGKSQLKTLIASETQGMPFNLSQQYLYSGFYVNELLTYLLAEHDEASEIYALYDALLKKLQAQQDLESSLRYFEFSLLGFLGYGIDFHNDAVSALPIDLTADYIFVGELGFVEKNLFFEQDTLPAGIHLSNATFYSGADILAIGQHDYRQEQTRRAAKQLSRSAMAPLLQGKVIKSRELFKGSAGQAK